MKIEMFLLEECLRYLKDLKFVSWLKDTIWEFEVFNVVKLKMMLKYIIFVQFYSSITNEQL